MSHQSALFVVLGMHRSGTSALTRGLEVLGVELGDNLYGALADNNAKGFFEDVELNELDQRLLKRLGHDWHSLEPVIAAELNTPRADVLRSEALMFLRERLQTHASYGIKDPRVSRLLPFWQPIFARIEAPVHYLIALRHPLSVARSLAKRDGFSVQKSLLLWREHMLAALLHTRGCSRRVVDFDALMSEPAEQLARIADLASLQFDTDGEAFRVYQQEFLDEDLRHTRFLPVDLQQLAACPAGVDDLYQHLLRMASDKSIDVCREAELLQHVSAEQGRDSALLSALADCDVRIGDLRQQADRLSVQCQDALAQLEQVRQRESSVVEELLDVRKQLAAAEIRLHERQARLDAQSETLRLQAQQIVDRGEHLATLGNTLTERDVQIARLVDELAGLHQMIQAQQAAHSAQLDGIYRSRSWRLTAPLRALIRLMRRQ